MSIEIDTKTAVPPKPTRPRASKYDPIFEQVQPGQSLKTRDKAKAKYLAIAFRKWIEKNRRGLVVSVRTDMDDGYHRVFLVKKPVKMADLPRRKIVNLGIGK